MGGELSEAQITEYRDAFKLFDTDGDGTISVQVNKNLPLPHPVVFSKDDSKNKLFCVYGCVWYGVV